MNACLFNAAGYKMTFLTSFPITNIKNDSAFYRENNKHFFFYHIQQTQDSTLSGTILTKPFVKGRVVLKVKDHLLAAYGGFHMKQ